MRLPSTDIGEIESCFSGGCTCRTCRGSEKPLSAAASLRCPFRFASVNSRSCLESKARRCARRNQIKMIVKNGWMSIRSVGAMKAWERSLAASVLDRADEVIE
jgi:hypothetical protein